MMGIVEQRAPKVALAYFDVVCSYCPLGHLDIQTPSRLNEKLAGFKMNNSQMPQPQ